MRGRGLIAGLVVGLAAVTGDGVWVEAQRVPAKPEMCRQESVEGEVAARQMFVRPIGDGLEVMLEPLGWGSGWMLRVLPVAGPRVAHDYAELATPPYASVNPLLISTDFSFRSQDALAWNPRRFRFAADEQEYRRVLDLYEQYTRHGGAAAGVENALAEAVSQEPEGRIEILDARLVPGMADQAPMAAAVASHFSTTAHTVELPETGKGSPLGRISWFRFRISLDLPRGFKAARGVTVKVGPCG